MLAAPREEHNRVVGYFVLATGSSTLVTICTRRKYKFQIPASMDQLLFEAVLQTGLPDKNRDLEMGSDDGK